MYKIIYSDKSKRNIVDIINYIGNFNYIKVVDSIKNSISLLELNPEMGVEIVKGEREVIETKYKYQIRYAIIGKEINILLIYKYNNIKGR
ncbi:MAG: type II toxin-antitoxin system RelE/ParE family toxin [Candidatus Gracilibacteria bacterium]|nr:type II toxin-antitoxin system RelE/ParE family toxin [Candidatus Gracilibacteria bacterium]